MPYFSQTARPLRGLGLLCGHTLPSGRSSQPSNWPSGVYRRIHTLTLANLGDAQCAQGRLGEAAANWDMAMDAMAGVKSGRAPAAVQNMRARLGGVG